MLSKNERAFVELGRLDYGLLNRQREDPYEASQLLKHDNTASFKLALERYDPVLTFRTGRPTRIFTHNEEGWRINYVANAFCYLFKSGQVSEETVEVLRHPSYRGMAAELVNEKINLQAKWALGIATPKEGN